MADGKYYVRPFLLMFLYCDGMAKGGFAQQASPALLIHVPIISCLWFSSRTVELRPRRASSLARRTSLRVFSP